MSNAASRVRAAFARSAQWLAGVGIGLGIGLQMAAPAAAPDESLWPFGRYVYQRNCLVCHGVAGDGRGEMGRTLRPLPRDFTRGEFKYRTTGAGLLPTDADLERTIRHGLTGTAMPMFTQLSAREVKSVIEYVKGFSPRWRHATNHGAARPLPATPGWIGEPSAMAKGGILFLNACAPCHGTDGAGRDATVRELTDARGEPATPVDLRVARLRSGDGPEAVYRVLLMGIEGTPMPSFAGAFTEEERWQVVAFVRSLNRERAGARE